MGEYHQIIEPGGLPPCETALELLQACYRDPGQPISRRIRCAIAALPFEGPKYAVIAAVGGGKDFAALIEAANAKRIELRGADVER
jgi:hypothetical protein